MFMEVPLVQGGNSTVNFGHVVWIKDNNPDSTAFFINGASLNIKLPYKKLRDDVAHLQAMVRKG
ncbi:MAG: hypothetical protein JNL61_06835 [Rhizobiaceae bacterium]|nr:hypothetical protein [Rhizobiaceae bacterium]